jgi:hypothetical protein
LLYLLSSLVPLLYSLLLCDAEYKNLPECRHRFVSSILNSVKKEGNPYYVSIIVYGLAKMDMSWDDLDDELCFLMEETIGAVRRSGDLKVGWHIPVCCFVYQSLLVVHETRVRHSDYGF